MFLKPTDFRIFNTIDPQIPKAKVDKREFIGSWLFSIPILLLGSHYYRSRAAPGPQKDLVFYEIKDYGKFKKIICIAALFFLAYKFPRIALSILGLSVLGGILIWSSKTHEERFRALDKTNLLIELPKENASRSGSSNSTSSTPRGPQPQPRGRLSVTGYEDVSSCPITESEFQKGDTVRGFSKMAASNFLTNQITQLCNENNAEFHSILDADTKDLFQLGELTQTTVFLINNAMHYSLYVVDPNKEEAIHYNSLQEQRNDLEIFFEGKLVGYKMYSNQKQDQKDVDGWSCGFRDLHALALIFPAQKQSLPFSSIVEKVDANPTKPEELRLALEEYVKGLQEEQETLPKGNEIFYTMNVEGKSAEQLGALLVQQSNKLFELNSELEEMKSEALQNATELSKNQRQALERIRTIETILLGAWKLDKKQPGSFKAFIQATNLTDQRQTRIGLATALNSRSWVREAMVNRFFSEYLEAHGSALAE